MGKPVVTARNRAVETYFPEGTAHHFRPGDAVDLASVIRRVAADPEEVRRGVRQGQGICREYAWSRERDALLRIFGAARQTASREWGDS